MTGKLSEASPTSRVPEISFFGESALRLIEDRVNFHLLERDAPVRIVIDSRGNVAGAIFVGLPGENHDGSRFAEEALDKGVLGVVVNREVWESVKVKAKSSGRSAICVGDPLLFFGQLAWEKRRQAGGTNFVGITGSAGKTTTKDMVSSILSMKGGTFKNPGNFNNLIGLPLSLMMIRDEDEYGVFEMGTNAPGEIGRLAEVLAPNVGVITNIGPAHLEGLGGVDGVQKEKGALFRELSSGDVAVVNEDDLRVKAVSDLCRCRKVFFGADRGDVTGAIVELRVDSMQMHFRYGSEKMEVSMSSPGLQFFRNALCASGVAFALGVSKEQVSEGLSRFHPDSGRFSIFKLGNEVMLVDDTYNSNPLSVEVAVESISRIFPGRKIILLLGDMLELGEAAESSHLRIGDLASSLNPYRIYTYGELAAKINEGALNAGFPESRCHHSSDVDELAERMLNDTASGSVILVKGSRMMKLERVVKKVIERLTPGSERA